MIVLYIYLIYVLSGLIAAIICTVIDYREGTAITYKYLLTLLFLSVFIGPVLLGAVISLLLKSSKLDIVLFKRRTKNVK